MPDITIAIADPHPVVRAGIGSFCEVQSGWRVAGECGTAAELAGLIAAAKPRYAIINPAIYETIPGGFVDHLPEIRMKTRPIAYAGFRDSRRVRSILRAGAVAYVLKDGPARELISAIAQVESGGAYVTALIGCELDSEAPEPPDPRALLSEREYQVFAALGSGARARDVAASLGLSAKTVDTYRAGILRKLDLDGLASLVRLAAAASGN